MERLLLLAGAILISCPAFAANMKPVPTPKPAAEDVTITANLMISKCSNPGGDMSLCGGVGAIPNVVTIPLKSTGEAGFYKGQNVLIEEIDGLRFLGIITIIRYDMSSPDGTVTSNYYVVVEILNNGKDSAKMSISVQDIKTLPYATVYGEGHTIGSIEYKPFLSIGAAPVCDPTNTNCSNSVTPPGVHWDVLRGSLL